MKKPQNLEEWERQRGTYCIWAFLIIFFITLGLASLDILSSGIELLIIAIMVGSSVLIYKKKINNEQYNRMNKRKFEVGQWFCKLKYHKAIEIYDKYREEDKGLCVCEHDDKCSYTEEECIKYCIEEEKE